MAIPSPHEDLSKLLHQQELMAEFGIEALRSRDPDGLLQTACRICAEGMEAVFSKILRPINADDLLVVAGVGWRDGVVGHATVGADLASPAGFALKTGKPVISNHLVDEPRFRTPKLMADHGIKRAVNVVIEKHGKAYGVLEVDSRDEGQYETKDLAFMTGFANLVGVALERHESESQLADAKKHQELLTREASHRVKNSLATVSAMISLQRSLSVDKAVREALADTQARIDAVVEAHDQLWRHPEVGMVDLGAFLGGIIEKIARQNDRLSIYLACDPLEVLADKAIPIGLLITELVTNATKYAYPGGSGEIRVEARAINNNLRVQVADDGAGLPEGFTFENPPKRSLGSQMIVSLSRQLHGTLDAVSGRGTTVTVDISLHGLQG